MWQMGDGVAYGIWNAFDGAPLAVHMIFYLLPTVRGVELVEKGTS